MADARHTAGGGGRRGAALHPGAPHEFDSIAFTSDAARRAIADRVRVLKSI
ncbi:hypothetical protein [Streptomyces rapamycinicus]|uniref:Uncharacterized protein n=2 Tax=Streptomyces rapamycinicus TaxID=1226757 RepID=A0A3L8R7E9_STRRN|nr:hypothetical protein [Streptomyces rapamycinicus]MBB4779751.1 hypothetical protein [Streptomyces rapamycinicus]RLV75591.1 hypothetical protein D3C57_140235 [Streptomyces rapamycinicus NRRL 5491]UTP28477.1 hypothetical protein LIV37_03425 [Streptomyces rapamycinicus NRRL 5491]